MKTLLYIILSLIVLLAVIAGLFVYEMNNVTDKKNLEQSLDKEVEKYLKKQNGGQLAIGVFKNGRTFYKSYNNSAPNYLDSNTVFELASTSKLFTTSLLQILADKNLVNLDATVQSILKDSLTMPAIASKTTLRHLATHTSGFPSLPNSFINKMKDEKNPYKDLTTKDLTDYLVTCEGKQTEGNFEYSNFGMGLLGYLLGKIGNSNYEQMVKDEFLNPLNMTNTFIYSDKDTHKNIIQGYDELDQSNPIWVDHVLTGAGSYLSSTSDMVKFVKANLSETNSPISPSLLKSHQPQFTAEGALGWMLSGSVDKILGNKNLLWHNGMAGGYSSYLAVDKTNQFGFVILSNKSIDVTSLGMRFAFNIRTQSW
jgi:serine-type D-Ala-D-Ala carboxypeptidase/endopeptidase